MVKRSNVAMRGLLAEEGGRLVSENGDELTFEVALRDTIERLIQGFGGTLAVRWRRLARPAQHTRTRPRSALGGQSR
jgi:hypothetical protein